MSDTPVATKRAEPRYELWIALAVSASPHVLASLGGHGYGQILGNGPLAIGLTIVVIAAVVIAYLQFREDSSASRPSHWLVWATIALGGIWVVYAVFVGLIMVFGQITCVNQTCRGLFH